MLAPALAFLAGIVSVHALTSLPSMLWSATLIPLLWLARRWPRLLLLCAFLAGVMWVSLRAGFVLEDRLADELEAVPLEIIGRIDSIPRPTPWGVRFEFTVSEAQLKGAPVRVPMRLLVSLRLKAGRTTVHAGERWRLWVTIKRPHGFINPGGFDYEAYLFQHRLRGRAYARAGERLQAAATLDLDALREHLGRSLDKALMARSFVDGAHRGVLIALANGDRAGIDRDQWRILRTTGTAHLMAISGLHIGLVAAFVYMLMLWLWRHTLLVRTHIPAPRVAAAMALMAALGYAALAGFSVPTQRALIMLAVIFGAILFMRRFYRDRVFALALVLVLLWDPMAVMSMGFWLSFLAVGVLLLAGLVRRPRMNWFGESLLAQWRLGLGLAPVLLFFFHEASLVAPVANLIAIPVFALVVVPLVLLGALISPWSPQIAGILLSGAHMGLDALWPVLDFMATHSPRWTQAASLPYVLLSMLGVLWLLAPRGVPGRMLGLFLLLPLMFPATSRPQAGAMRFTLLDVGQGLAAMIETRNHVLVYDTGARFSRDFDAGSAVLTPYLRTRGITRINKLMLSHGDNDHIGGAAALVRRFDVAAVLSSVPSRVRPLHAGVVPCEAGQQWHWDGVWFRMLSPPKGGYGEDNDASCVLHVSSAHGAVLLTGDITRRAEHMLVRRYGRTLGATVLVAPHHGSRSSSSRAFLEAVDARIAVIAAGYRNRYHHPHPEVLARYRELGVRYYTSATDGAIDIQFDRASIQIETARAKKRYWWH